MNYRLKKLEIKEGCYSKVPPEREVKSSRIIHHKDDFQDDFVIENVDIGDTLLVGNNIFYMTKTSPITKILEQTDNYLKFETESSVYELELTEPKDD